MATSKNEMEHNLNYRRYKDGDDSWSRNTDKIFQASWTHKCPTYVQRTPPCQGSCPAGEDIRGWLDIVRGIEKPKEGLKWQEYAFYRSTDANPFPAVMGRVCPAPCEDGCNRNELEDHVGINSVEQFIGDYGLDNKLSFSDLVAKEETGKKIAIIGGGPAGLAAAYQLRRMGHGCTVFDDHAKLGGMMEYGIPGYRTPRDVLDGEMQRIVNMGVEVKLNTRVGSDISIETLENDYDAILWAVGTHSGRPLPIPGAEATNVITGVDFLRAFNDGRLQLAAEKVVVVGGGDTSIDVASVARRLGHIKNIHEKDRPENVILGHTAHDVASSAIRDGANVTLMSRASIENMPAAQHEIDDALREGVNIIGQVSPVEALLDSDGRCRAVKVIKLEEDGSTPIEGSEYEIECTLLVAAIGQKGDLSNGLEAMDNGHGFIDADKHYQVPNKKGHFVAGDIVRPHLLTTAIGQASIAAESIDHYLKNEELARRPKVDKHQFDLLDKLREAGLHEGFGEYDHSVEGTRGTSDGDFAVHNYENRSDDEIIPAEELFLGHFTVEARHKREEIPVTEEEVLGHFKERMIGLSEEETVKEADRCMSCGMCFECDNCVIYCPQDAVHRTPKKEATMGRYVYTDYTACVGCHICADVCPTGYIDMAMNVDGI